MASDFFIFVPLICKYFQNICNWILYDFFSFLKIYHFYFIPTLFFLNVSLYTIHVPHASRSQKTVLDPLELAVVSGHVDALNRIPDPLQEQLVATFPAPGSGFFNW